MKELFFTVESKEQLSAVVLATLFGAFLGIRREIDASLSEKNRSFMGLRTMTVLALLGCISTFFPTMPYLPVVLFGAVIVLVGIAYVHGSFEMHRIGITTELSAMMIYWVGVMVALKMIGLAIFITIILALNNAYKQEFRTFVKTLSMREWRGALQLLIVTGLILPLLPNAPVDPWGVVNPFETWLLVIMISGIGFLGYFLIKYFGTKSGIPLMSLLGGIVSSTAVTTAMSSRSKKVKMPGLLVAGILIALGTMQLKVFFYIVSIGSGLELDLKLYLTPWILSVGCLLFAVYYFRVAGRKQERAWFSLSRGDPKEEFHMASPFELLPALKFGLVYLAILFILHFGQIVLGNTGVYIAAILSGIIDIDSIVLASLRQASSGDMDLSVAQNSIALALFCNTFVKIIFIRILGAGYLFKEAFVGIGGAILVGGSVYLLM